MKKVLFLLGTMLAFIACGDKSIDMESPVADAQDDDFKVNITISREGDTKAAYVKNDFADGDVVFICFRGITSPKYLEMKYNAAAQDWTATAKNGLTANDFLEASTPTLTAVYFPYGSDAIVEKKEHSSNYYFVQQINLDDLPSGEQNYAQYSYHGYFLYDQNCNYTFENGLLSANINLGMVQLDPQFGHVHFNVTGFTPGHTYEVCVEDCRGANYGSGPSYYSNQELKYLVFNQLSGACVVSKDVRDSYNDYSMCYEDCSNLTFSMVFNKDIDMDHGSYLSYGTYEYIDFVIYDLTDNVCFRKRFTDKTINDGDYIGLGNISSEFFSTWEKEEFIP